MSIFIVKSQVKELLQDLQAFLAASDNWENLVGDQSFDRLNNVDYDYFMQLFASISRDVINAVHKSQKLLDVLDKDSAIKDKIENNTVTIQDLEAMASLASEFDAADDEVLSKQADILDTALLILSEKQKQILVQAAEEDNFQKLKKQYLDREKEEKYDKPREILSELNKTQGLGEKYSQKMQEKQYRPMQHSLSTRYCPDHPGIGMLFLSEGRYQCAMDKKIYDFKNGYTTLDGDKVPGGSVDLQNREFLDRVNNRVNYDTRENRTKR